jgi:hemoglobin
MAHDDTIFEAAGGLSGLSRLAHAWHERVLADPVVEHAFSHGYHPDHTHRLATYWAEALGGPADYSQTMADESMVIRLHSGKGEHDDMDERAIACFEAALDDVGFAADPRLFLALVGYFQWATTGPMAAYPDSADQVPDGLAIARWGWDGPL